MAKFEPIATNDSSAVVERYASLFVESIKEHCENAAEKAVKEVVKDVEFLSECKSDISKYQITYGLANNNNASKAKRNLFDNYKFIPHASNKFCEEKSLSLWSDFSYREYEKECHEAVVCKISELIQKKFNNAENKQLCENLNVECEFRGYFVDGKRQYSKIVPLALSCLIPGLGCLLFCDMFEPTCESTYDGEALIRIFGKSMEKN